MEHIPFIKELERIGLPDKAAVIYVSLLGKSRMGVADIVRQADVRRATCYEYLDLLLKKGFITRIPIGKRTLYAAVDPKTVAANLRKELLAFDSTAAVMSKIYERATNKPKVGFFEGKRAIKNIYEELFKTLGDTYSIFPADIFFENFTEAEYGDFDKTNSDHAFKAKDLFIASAKTYKKLRALREKNGYENKSDKRLPEWFTSNVDVLVFNEKVALISLRDLSAVVIENKDIANLFKNMHAFMWKAL
ncbi:MAG: helix-turn-helix domain-containing protein [bacterium]